MIDLLACFLKYWRLLCVIYVYKRFPMLCYILFEKGKKAPQKKIAEMITWNGGACPVDQFQSVNIVTRNCKIYRKLACEISWTHYNTGKDIMAYEVI